MQTPKMDPLEHSACEVFAAARDMIAFVRNGDVPNSGRLGLALRALAIDLANLPDVAAPPPAPTKSRTRTRAPRLTLVK